MKDLLQLLIKHNIRFVDHANETLIFDKPNTALAAFAIDDAIATNVGNRLAPPTIRFGCILIRLCSVFLMHVYRTCKMGLSF